MILHNQVEKQGEQERWGLHVASFYEHFQRLHDHRVIQVDVMTFEIPMSLGATRNATVTNSCMNARLTVTQELEMSREHSNNRASIGLWV